jgi:hypothetical protein
MRLYEIFAVELDDDNKPVEKHFWVGTKADVSAKRKELNQAGIPRKHITDREVDVPTDKTGLLAFLNARAND